MSDMKYWKERFDSINSNRKTWIHAEDDGIVKKIDWTIQKNKKYHPFAKNQLYKCPKCKSTPVHSLALCHMDNLASSPWWTTWIYKCKSCGFMFDTDDGYLIEEKKCDCGDLGW
jgi:predicted RNA-binding Zn-ribbon protein involved in translation (DUF1610 family)